MWKLSVGLSLRRLLMSAMFFTLCGFLGFLLPIISAYWQLHADEITAAHRAMGYVETPRSYELAPPASQLSLVESGEDYLRTGVIKDWHLSIGRQSPIETLLTFFDSHSRGTWNVCVAQIASPSQPGLIIGYKQFANTRLGFNDVVQIRLADPDDVTSFRDFQDFNNDGKFDVMAIRKKAVENQVFVMYDSCWQLISGRLSLGPVTIKALDGDDIIVNWSGSSWKTVD